MKNTLGTCTALIVLGTSMYAQDINVTSGWHLKGASENITNLEVFTSDCVSTVWTYDNGWKAYSSDSSTRSALEATLGSDKILDSINNEDGFWINGKSTCSIDTRSTFMDSKKLKIEETGNSSEGYVVFSLDVNGTGTEIGYYSGGSVEYSENINWSYDEMTYTLSVTLLSDNSSSTTVFTSTPDQNVTGTYSESGSDMNITVLEFGEFYNENNLPDDSLYTDWSTSIETYTQESFEEDILVNSGSYGKYIEFLQPISMNGNHPYYLGDNGTICLSDWVSGLGYRKNTSCSQDDDTYWVKVDDTFVAHRNGKTAFLKLIDNNDMIYMIEND